MASKGQVTIPEEVRQLLGAKDHEKVAFVVDGNLIRLMRKGSVVERTAGMLKTG